jgi:hypothetical protein
VKVGAEGHDTARPAAARLGAGKPDLDNDIVPASAFAHRVQRLVNVADAVHGIAECIPLEVVGRRTSQLRLQTLQLGDDAVALRGGVAVLGSVVSIVR